MTDVPFGVLLSGGLDSSLVASVVSRHLAEAKVAKQWGNKLHTFCIGLKGSPDLKAAKEVADYLGTVHHELHFTVQEGIDALEEVIYHIETYDVTTIRASTPMFLMSRKIKSLGVKMVLSGEGSDEIFGGYLYFHKAPNKKEFHEETCRKIKALHLYDCLRANKATSAWGVEARVPFLDKNFINVAMDIDPEWKMIRRDLGRIEKWVLRNAFDDEEKPYLPKHILYRQKEQFSDGVGYSWIDGLKDHANEHNAARLTVPGGPSIACSTAKAIEWDAAWSKNLDPSGRAALGVHDAAYEDTVEKSPASANPVADNGFSPALGESIIKTVASATAV
uniref:Asparagine synthetase domain-containing protein n=1 Tax=Leersia perrieri TaxID=77586 RepID=A0A0D9WP36_9ORYZ